MTTLQTLRAVELACPFPGTVQIYGPERAALIRVLLRDVSSRYGDGHLCSNSPIGDHSQHLSQGDAST